THPWNRALDERLEGPPTSTLKTAESSEQRLVARRVKACQGIVMYAPVQYPSGKARHRACPSKWFARQRKMVCASSQNGLRQGGKMVCAHLENNGRPWENDLRVGLSLVCATGVGV